MEQTYVDGLLAFSGMMGSILALIMVFSESILKN